MSLFIHTMMFPVLPILLLFLVYPPEWSSHHLKRYGLVQTRLYGGLYTGSNVTWSSEYYAKNRSRWTETWYLLGIKCSKKKSRFLEPWIRYIVIVSVSVSCLFSHLLTTTTLKSLSVCQLSQFFPVIMFWFWFIFPQTN